ncbi:MAG: prefoldin subunit [Candidatus Woesearchaeota archaeon]|nr:prefoldin subunit [Candidatus Woesearchaeota archaeon]
MKLTKETEQKIAELQLLEQNLQNFILQKQTFQAQFLEVDNALNELNNSKEAYKIIGPIMVHSTTEELKKDLNSKKEILNLRIKNIEKQEDKLKEKADSIQSEVLKQIKK